MNGGGHYCHLTFIYILDGNECESNPCHRNSQCKLAGDSYECVCPENWGGKKCHGKYCWSTIHSHELIPSAVPVPYSTAY